MKTLARRANVAVFICIALELILAEQARLDRGTALRARHIEHDPGLLARNHSVFQLTSLVRVLFYSPSLRRSTGLSPSQGDSKLTNPNNECRTLTVDELHLV